MEINKKNPHNSRKTFPNSLKIFLGGKTRSAFEGCITLEHQKSWNFPFEKIEIIELQLIKLVFSDTNIFPTFPAYEKTYVWFFSFSSPISENASFSSFFSLSGRPVYVKIKYLVFLWIIYPCNIIYPSHLFLIRVGRYMEQVLISS